MRLNGISRRFAVMTGVAITVMVIGGSSCDGTYVPPPAGTVATGVTPYCANRPVPAGCPGYALNPVATPAVNCASFPIPAGSRSRWAVRAVLPYRLPHRLHGP